MTASCETSSLPMPPRVPQGAGPSGFAARGHKSSYSVPHSSLQGPPTSASTDPLSLDKNKNDSELANCMTTATTAIDAFSNAVIDLMPPRFGGGGEMSADDALDERGYDDEFFCSRGGLDSSVPDVTNPVSRERAAVAFGGGSSVTEQHVFSHSTTPRELSKLAESDTFDLPGDVESALLHTEHRFSLE